MIIESILAAYLALIIPAIEFYGFLTNSKTIRKGEFSKMRFYIGTLIELWMPVLLLVGLMVFSVISLNNLGLRALVFNPKDISLFVLIPFFIIVGLLLAYAVYQVLMLKFSAEYRKQYLEAVRKQSAKPSKYDQTIQAIMPSTKREKQMWAIVALTAGITEEILYRGFLFYYLQALFPGISIWLVVLIPAAIFSLGHFYQGFQGILMTFIVGFAFGILYLAFDSILPLIVIHFLMDIQGVFIDVPKEESAVIEAIDQPTVPSGTTDPVE